VPASYEALQLEKENSRACLLPWRCRRAGCGEGRVAAPASQRRMAPRSGACSSRVETQLGARQRPLAVGALCAVSVCCRPALLVSVCATPACAAAQRMQRAQVGNAAACQVEKCGVSVRRQREPHEARGAPAVQQRLPCQPCHAPRPPMSLLSQPACAIRRAAGESPAWQVRESSSAARPVVRWQRG